MKRINILALTILLLSPLSAYASETEERVVTYKVVDLANIINKTTPGRTYTTDRPIKIDEARRLQSIIKEGNFPADFSWHLGKNQSKISKVIGVVPPSFLTDEDLRDRLHNFSVPNLKSTQANLPTFDMVVKYIDPTNVDHYFAIRFKDNKYIG